MNNYTDYTDHTNYAMNNSTDYFWPQKFMDCTNEANLARMPFIVDDGVFTEIDSANKNVYVELCFKYVNGTHIPKTWSPLNGAFIFNAEFFALVQFVLIFCAWSVVSCFYLAGKDSMGRIEQTGQDAAERCVQKEFIRLFSKFI